MSFEARYHGECAACGGHINPGTEGTYDMFDRIVHAKCPPDLTVLARPVCPTCLLELPATGVCDDCDG